MLRVDFISCAELGSFSLNELLHVYILGAN